MVFSIKMGVMRPTTKFHTWDRNAKNRQRFWKLGLVEEVEQERTQLLTVEQATPFDRNELGMTSGGIVQGMGDQEVPKI